MAGSSMVKAMCIVLVSMAMLAATADAALSCSTVANDLSPCLNFVLYGGALPPECCNGIKTLYAAAATTADRQSVCSCLKSVAGSASSAAISNAASIPGRCGLKIPYKLSPSTDCAKVH